MSQRLFTAIARCRVCGKEINRAQHVPEDRKQDVRIASPLLCLCDVRSHNTGSDYNLAFDLEWIEEGKDGPA